MVRRCGHLQALNLRPHKGSYVRHIAKLDEDEKAQVSRDAILNATPRLKGGVVGGSPQAPASTSEPADPLEDENGPNAWVISESGLYTMIVRSRAATTPGTLPHRFRRWITGEVLPSIRRTGSYCTALGQAHQAGRRVQRTRPIRHDGGPWACYAHTALSARGATGRRSRERGRLDGSDYENGRSVVAQSRAPGCHWPRDPGLLSRRQDWSGQSGKGRHSPIGFSHCNIAEHKLTRINKGGAPQSLRRTTTRRDSAGVAARTAAIRRLGRHPPPFHSLPTHACSLRK